MTYFPQISASGVMVQRPYGQSVRFSTLVQDMPFGKRYSYSEWGGGLSRYPSGPLNRFELQYPSITDAEVAALQSFFTQAEGRLNEFTYLDPGGNLVNWSEDFTQTAWTKQSVTPGASVSDPFGGNRGMMVAGGGSNGMLFTTVLPNGGASGFVLCGSVWAKAQSPGQQLSIGFIDSGFGVISNTTWNLPQGSWVRVWNTATLATSSYIRLLIGGLATWGSTSIALFGAQVAPLPGPGAYRKTPGSEGLRAKCRFDTDDFEARSLGPNQNAVKLSVIEYF